MAKSPAKTRKPRAKTAPENETKEERFNRLALSRMPRVLKAIKNIGNLSGSGYGYTPEQIEKMETAITAMVKQTFAKFKRTPGEKKEEGFSF